jgi:hypothetical protein
MVVGYKDIKFVSEVSCKRMVVNGRPFWIVGLLDAEDDETNLKRKREARFI